MSSSQSPLPLVSVVVEGTTDASGHYVHHTFRSLAEQTYPRERIELVFMDASEDGSVGRRAAELWPGAVVVPAASLRYYDMKNVGAQRAQGDIVGFIDSDVTWNREWIGEAVAALAPLPPYSAVVGLTRYLPGMFSDAGTISQFGYHWYKYASGDYDGLLGVIANNFAVRRKEFLEVQYRHTEFRQGMDMVLSSDLQERGGSIRLNPRMRAMHKWGKSKIWEHPTTAYNVGRGLTTALHNCGLFLRSDGPAQAHLSRFGMRVDPEWLLGGSTLGTLALVVVRFWLFQGYLRRTRQILEVRPYQVVTGTVFLAGFFGVIGIGALSHRRAALGDGRVARGTASPGPPSVANPAVRGSGEE